MLMGAELPPRALRERNPGPYLFYLDAWERVVTAAEDPRLLDPAFGGVDTALRLQSVSQVRWRVEGARDDPRHIVAGALRVSASREAAPIPNRFVRVEIHHAGFARGRADAPGAPAFPGLEFERNAGDAFKLLDTPFAPLVAGQPVELANGDPSLTFETELRAVASGDDGRQTFHVGPADLARLNDGLSSWRLRPLATFKWSRDNGATVFPIAAFDAARLTLRIANPADKRGVLAPGIWVEVLDDGSELAGAPGALRGVAALDEEDFGFVSLGLDAAAPEFPREPRNPRLRTWDPIEQSGGLSGCAVVEAGGKTLLAGGLEIEFTGGRYLTQDYWTVAVRAELDWPRDSRDAPLFQRARGVRHRAMPLASVVFAGGLVRVTDLRRVFRPLTDPAPPPTPEVVETPADASIFTFSARAEPGWRYAGSRISAPNDAPRWTAARPPPFGLVRAAAGAGEHLHCLAADERLWRYDPHADQWETLAELDDHDLTDVEMAELDGRLHLLGWKGDAIGHWAFLLDENRWERRPRPPVARHDFAFASANNRLYAAGGIERGSRRLSDRVETYDPARDAWESSPSRLAGPAAGVGLASLDGRLYAGGGIVPRCLGFGRRLTASLRVRAPGHDAWSDIAPMETARRGAKFAFTASHLHVAGGTGPQGEILPDAMLDLATRTWREAPRLSEPRPVLALVALRGSLYRVEGGANGEVARCPFERTLYLHSRIPKA